MTKPLRTFAPLRIALAVLVVLGAAAGCDPAGNGPRDEPDLGPTCPAVGQVPVDEICNAFDDDCDGVMDEGVCDDPCGVFDERPLE